MLIQNTKTIFYNETIRMNFDNETCNGIFVFFQSIKILINIMNFLFIVLVSIL
jgi:hypothetical protein